MGKSGCFHLGALTLAFGAAVVVSPSTAAALGPIQPTAAGFVSIGVDSGVPLKGDSTDPNAPALGGWTNLSSFQLETASVNGGPPTVSTISLMRTVTLREQGFKLPMGKKLAAVNVLLREAPSGGSATWLGVTLEDATVKFDTVRSSEGATTGTENLVLTFSSLKGRQSTQTTQDTNLVYTALPAWFDFLHTFRLDASAPGPVIGPGRRMPVAAEKF
jgi:hypothetical protein